ncbi:Heavy metal-associated isoprenylated plant protein 26 [Apostasia shenzhenica]|uniref:Heavy metal-associated isoprenylated plant protein 26 n=1 Tax=Apostasia shenzhenica TaxID=1088818 RepID=A0A2I0AHK7_9ASPA|nr:Heavy metal-associated isoprenylated plant protein 26 [Apostasia shenzhenica]
MKIKRSIRGFEGVENMTIDTAGNRLTVIGKLDPWKLRDRVEEKTRKKVEIISPSKPPKSSGGESGGGKKLTDVGDDQKKPEDNKSREVLAESYQLELDFLFSRLNYNGCTQRIKRAILKIKGVKEVSVDALKDLVTVKGTMDVKSLPEFLKEKLKRGVEVVPAKKDGGAAAAGEKDQKGGGGEKKGKEKEEVAVAIPPPAAVEANKLAYYGSHGYRVEMLHAPQLFSDDNPNACSVM